MPQLSDRFGPIQSQVVLNGSGGGQVTFQPNGSNARITNLFVKVAPIPPATAPANQAQCFMYKGQVADSNLIQNTNSGSTGAAAQGSIDLMDGETLYVVWTGGDPGATASATFVGNTIPFDQIGSANITWEDPIAAGDGSLIYPQVRSPNFTTGVSGWILRRDGSVEFGSAVIRGSVSAAGGNVILNDLGIRVVGTTGTVEYLVNRSGGFVARNIPDDGALVQTFPGNINTVTPDGSGGYFVTDGGSPAHTATMRPSGVRVSDRIVNTSSGMDYTATQLFNVNVNVVAGGTGLQTSGAINYPIAFPVGSTLFGFTNLQSAAANARHWYAQWVNTSNTQYELILTNTTGTSPDARALTFNVGVYVL